MNGSTEASTLPSRLTSSEALLWTIERDPALRSTIMGIALLEGQVDAERLRQRVALAAQAFPRLRQRVAHSRRGSLIWQETPDWDPDQHLTHVRLPSPGALRQVLDVAGTQAGEAFDPARPLWHLTLVDGLDDAASALVVKMHHSITDGIGGVHLLWLLTDAEPHPSGPPDLTPRQRRPRRRRPSPVVVAAEALASAIGDPLHAVQAAPKVARSALKLLAPASHALSPLTTKRGLDRHLDVIDVPLQALERAGHAVGGTVNDAFMAAVVGGLRRYHAAHGAVPSELRVTMPISVRKAGDGPGGNRFAPARFTVPLDGDDPARRMEEIGAIAHRWREEPAVGMTDVLADALTRLPDAVTTTVFGSMLKGVDFVASNVPGSRSRCWLAGAEVVRLFGFAPPSGSAMSITLVSHVGRACVGVNSDSAAVDDPALLRESLQQGIDEVVAVGRAKRGRRKHQPTPPDIGADHVGNGHHTVRPAPRRLSALDTSFLEAETPNAPMHVGALIVMDGAPLRDAKGELRIEEIRAAIVSQLPRSPRMRQVAVPVPLARPMWQDDPDFDIADHVRHVRVPAPGTRAELEALCCELQMQVLDRSKPLWEMWFVDGLVDGTVGLVYKVHHAVVDGVSAAETFEVLLGGGDLPIVDRGSNPVALTPAQRLVTAAIDDTRAAARLWLGTGASFITRPAMAVGTAVGLGSLVRPASIAPRTSLNQPIGRQRRLVPVELGLADVKAIARGLGVTVNDVVLTMVGSGLGALFERRHEHVDHVQVLVPVSLRGDGDHNGAGNRVAGLMARIPIEPDPVQAIAAVAAETRALKSGPEAATLDLLLRASDTWPMGLLAQASRQIVHRQPFVNLVVTNVRGAERPLTLLGARILEIVPLVPLGGNMSLGVAVLSYAGRLHIGLHADADACPDVDLVADGIRAGFARLEAETRVKKRSREGRGRART